MEACEATKEGLVRRTSIGVLLTREVLLLSSGAISAPRLLRDRRDLDYRVDLAKARNVGDSKPIHESLLYLGAT